MKVAWKGCHGCSREYQIVFGAFQEVVQEWVFDTFVELLDGVGAVVSVV